MMDASPSDLSRVRDLYARGLYRQALAAGEGFGPVRDWHGPAALLLAGRLAVQLGAPRLGRRLHLATFRASPAYPEAIYYHARYRLERFGPLSAWRFLRDHPDWSDAPPELRADWLSLTAYTAARLRDFDRAERLLARADAIVPDRPWVNVERASVLEEAGRWDEALASARQALAAHPWFRPGVQAVGHLLQRRGREAEAIEFLAEAAEHIESSLVVAQLALLHIDRGQLTDARRALDRYAELCPLMETETAEWLAARRADVAYLLGDFGTAAELARQAAGDFYGPFAENLERGVHSGRMILPVELGYDGPPPSPHDLLARFWGRPTPPADPSPPPADGLPDAAERRRYDAAGWLTREFTLTSDVAVSLITRGVPILVGLVEAGFGQSRLAVGADPTRGSLFLTDGTERRPTEAPIRVLVERMAAFGPRCLAALPPEEVGRLDGLELPDAEPFDRLYAIQSDLLACRLTEAKAKLAALRAEFPGHRLTKQAAQAWARAAAHPALLLDAANDRLADFPRDPTLLLAKATALRDLGRNAERLALLREVGGAIDAEPLLMQTLAQMLLPDPRCQAEADRLLRRSVRVRQHAAVGYFLLAAQWWEDQRFEEAADLYRFATCLDDTEEQFADAFTKVAKTLGHLPEALRLFQRAVRAETPNPCAVKALFEALLDRGEPEQAFSALDKAIEKLERNPGTPAYADLRLFRAESQANRRRFAEAEADLAAVKSAAPPVAWHKAAARVARARPDYTEALGHVRAVLDREPLNPDAHRIAAGLIADTEGRAAALAALANAVQKFPDSYPLARFRIEFLSREPDDEAVAATRALLEQCPHDAWAQRQLALVLADRRRHDEALAAATAAGKVESDHPSYFAVLGHVHRRADRPEQALEAFRNGVKAMPDHELCIAELVQVSRGVKEKKAALRFLAGVLPDRSQTGEGVLAYFEQAVRLVEDPDDQEALIRVLEGFLESRPDLWQCWSVVIQTLAMSHRTEEAISLARTATSRFPLAARLWLDLAECCRLAGRAEDHHEALRRAADVMPGWPPVAKELADVLAAEGDEDGAIAVLTAAADRNPLDPFAHWVLAEQLWHAGRAEQALERAMLSVRHEPANPPDSDPRPDMAWGAVMVWADRLDRPELPAELARQLAKDRAGDTRSWLRLARTLNDPGQAAEALAALDQALKLDPRNVEAHDQKAEKLAQVGRFDEALQAARPSQLAPDLPLILQGRAAWVEARRGNYSAAIPPMQALLAVDPGYAWGWQQLAEWYNDTGKLHNYLEAASELARLRPESPVSLAMRGEAKIQTGDRDGGKADLREVLRSFPNYSPAAVILFDACLADGELKEARSALAVLQEYLVGPEVLVKQLQYALRAEDAEAAARAFAEICQHPGEGTPLFLQMGLAEMRSGGLGDKADELLGEAWRSGDEFNPWAAIYWLDTPAGEAAPTDEKLTACDSALKHYPTFVPAHDRRAEQLASARRFAEAEAACAPAGVGPPIPVALRGRAAWVEAQKGNRDEAIERMKAVVTEEPDYTWGWRQLTAWYDAAGRHAECLEAADHLVRLNPNDALAFGIRGEARRAVGDHRGSKDDFERAFSLDPSFDAAGLQLVTAQLATDDLAGAAFTVNTLREHADGPLVKLRAVQVAARRGDLAAARKCFLALGRDPEATRGILREAAAALAEAGWEAEADEDLDALALDPQANPEAAGVWAERWVHAGEPGKVADLIPEVAEANRAAGREAAVTYAWMVAAQGRPDLVRAAVQGHAEMLREDDDGWARAGAALAAAKQWGLAAAWLGDWKGRPGCTPWMLRPLAEAFRALDRDDDADRLIRDAVADLEPDDVPDEFLAWLALSDGLAGRTAEAALRLDAVDRIGLPDATNLILALADALVAVQRAAPAERAVAFAEAKENLRAAAGACSPQDVPPGTTRAWRAAAERLAADTGTLPAKLWAWWQRVAPWVRER